MSRIFQCIEAVQNILWSVPMLAALMGTHLYFTYKLHFIQKKTLLGIQLSMEKRGQDGRRLSSFSALATSLAATIGTGNIIGISTAIAIGGPGSVFWCWITGVLGMATCYAECFLSVKYRVRKKEENNEIHLGGPMYVMEQVLGQKSAAVLFAAAVIFVSFGMGSSVQSHSISSAIISELEMDAKFIGIMLVVLTALVISGGVGKITRICTWLVPFMSLFYLGGCLWLLWINREILPETVDLIMKSAFGVRPVLCGTSGGMFLTAMRTGISRGLFTNEAGLGSIPISAAASEVEGAENQALISMTGPFWDTVVMCAVTGLTIVSCMIEDPQKFISAADDRLCFLAFSGISVWGERMLSVSLVLFAFATILGWYFYGECAVKYLFGQRGIGPYQICYILSVYGGVILTLDAVWAVSDIANSLMMLPNLICLWILRKKILEK